MSELEFNSLCRALGSSDVKARRRAAAKLGESASSNAVGPLIAALKDLEVRRQAADALVRIGKESVEALVQALEVDDGDPSVRRTAAETLGRIRDARAVEPLVQTLQEVNVDLRYTATEALGRIRDPRAVQPLVSVLTEPDRILRCHAVQALGRIGDPRAIVALAELVGESDVELLKTVAEALGRIRSAEAVEPLLALLKSSERQIKIEATEALGKIADPRAVQPILDALLDDLRTYGGFDAAYKGLRSIGEPAMEALFGLLNHEKAHVRRRATEVLGEIGDLRAAEPLLGLLRDDDELVQFEAVRALGLVGDERAVRPLLNSRFVPSVEGALERLLERSASRIEVDVLRELSELKVGHVVEEGPYPHPVDDSPYHELIRTYRDAPRVQHLAREELARRGHPFSSSG